MLANSSDDSPATVANFCRSSPPAATADSIADSVWVIAVPPASASIPTEDIAVARPRISWLVKPANVPEAAKRLAMLTMSDSVVAKLFPRATTELPNR